MKISIIIKTHNSERFIHKAIDSINKQTLLPHQVIIVDTASKDPSYLSPYQNKKNYHLIIEKEDLGFCKGNNLGYQLVKPDTEYVLFLNPDTFLTPKFLFDASLYLEENPSVGMITGTLYGYDINQDKLSGKYDSTGIFCTWYGKWYDRAQGQKIDFHRFVEPEPVPAICGALMFCRKKALDQAAISPGQIFDNSFFMYKEDIDLSLRLRKKGWELMHIPRLTAYHCRGWHQRKKISKQLRLCSAKNELKIQVKHHKLGSFYSLMKYLLVKTLNI